MSFFIREKRGAGCTCTVVEVKVEEKPGNEVSPKSAASRDYRK